VDPKLAPNALVAAYEWEQYVDLLTIRDFSRVTTARVPKRGAVDIFAPEVVVWAYDGAPQQALRALLDLVHPAHSDASIAEFPAPAGLHVPRSQQRPMTIGTVRLDCSLVDPGCWRSSTAAVFIKRVPHAVVVMARRLRLSLREFMPM
jgi:hypothetical protein